MTQGAAVGFIGLGAMGAPMAARLLDAGNTLVVCDTRAAALAPLLEHGAQAAATSAEVATRCSTVFACLPTPSVVEEVALGSEGLAAGAPCPDCDGGTLVRRADDEPAAVRTRLDVYRAQTLPVLEWYEGDGAAVRTIDAVGDVDAVTRRALDALGIAEPRGAAGRGVA